MANVHTWRFLKDSSGTILDGVAKTATFSSETLKPGNASHIALLCDVNTVSGTSPTLDIKAQISMDGGTTWLDCYQGKWPATIASNKNATDQAALAQITAATETMEVFPNWCAPQASSTINPVMKFVFTIGGTNPSFTSDFYIGFIQDRPV